MSLLNPIISFITTYSLDVAIIAVVFLTLSAYGIWFEKHRLTSFILSFYIAYLLFSNFPWLSSINFFGKKETTLLFSQSVTFLALVTLSIFVLNRIIKGRFPPSGIVRWFKIVILSLAGTGFILSLSYHAFPTGALYNFSGPIASLLEPAKMFFCWLIIPLIILFLLFKPTV